MAEKLKNMTYAELPKSFDAYQHILADFHHEPVIESMLGTGKRSTEVQASVFDAMMAEIMDDRMAEKAKYRRQRKDARKYKELPEERKHRKERRKDRLFGYYYGPCIKVEGHPESLPINHRRSAEAEKILRADWDTEIDAIIDDLDWAYMDMEYLDEKIEMLRHNLHVGDNYVRYNRLCERRKVVEEVIRKNRFVEEMLKGEN